MAGHKVYRCIVTAFKGGELKEPFTKDDFRIVCPNFAEGTYSVFLKKHRLGNSGGNTELFKEVSPGKFEIIRPFKYGFND